MITFCDELMYNLLLYDEFDRETFEKALETLHSVLKYIFKKMNSKNSKNDSAKNIAVLIFNIFGKINAKHTHHVLMWPQMFDSYVPLDHIAYFVEQKYLNITSGSLHRI